MVMLMVLLLALVDWKTNDAKYAPVYSMVMMMNVVPPCDHDYCHCCYRLLYDDDHSVVRMPRLMLMTMVRQEYELVRTMIGSVLFELVQVEQATIKHITMIRLLRWQEARDVNSAILHSVVVLTWNHWNWCLH
jgi:hypothetical protein